MLRVIIHHCRLLIPWLQHNQFFSLPYICITFFFLLSVVIICSFCNLSFSCRQRVSIIPNCILFPSHSHGFIRFIHLQYIHPSFSSASLLITIFSFLHGLQREVFLLHHVFFTQNFFPLLHLHSIILSVFFIVSQARWIAFLLQAKRSMKRYRERGSEWKGWKEGIKWRGRGRIKLLEEKRESEREGKSARG